MSSLSIVDILVIAAYFLVLSGIAYWALGEVVAALCGAGRSVEHIA